MKTFLSTLVLLLMILVGCNTNSDDKKAQSIYDEINQLLTQMEQISRETLKQPNIFTENSVKNFPANRAQLEPVANEQIRLFNEINKLNEIQIEKLKQVESLKLERNFLEHTKLLRFIQEKRMEGTKLGIQKFHLIVDNNISTHQQLEENISTIKQKQAAVDFEINQLEEQRRAIKLTGK